MAKVSSALALALLALVASSVVAVEVIMTRVLSLSTWYGLAFVVLSLAMLGLTAGSLAADKAMREGTPSVPWVASRLVATALSLLLGIAIVCAVPLTYGLGSFMSILLVTGFIAAPLVFAGAIIARLMAESDVPLPVLYGVDLVSAAGGALLPLAILGPLSAPGAVALIAALLALAAIPLATGPWRERSCIVTGCAVALLLLTELTPVGFHVAYPKGARAPEKPLFEEWNPLSHVEIQQFSEIEASRVLWSPSPTLDPARVVMRANANLDGDAGTWVYGYESLVNLDFLRFDATTAAHAIRPTGPACVIGVGGGRDILSALYFGHDSVLAAEINPSIIRGLRAAMPSSPALLDPRVHVEVGDGRSVFARYPGRCRVLQASLVDTWAATSAGAFAQSESTLYTREAWSIFLRRVEPDGVLTFSRWYAPSRPSETSRLVSLAVASLLDRGVQHPDQHIAVIAAGLVATILVSPAPFSDTDRAVLEKLASEMQFQLIFAPGHPPEDPILRSILAATDVGALRQAGEASNLDTDPPTDDRPFFFQLLRPAAWLHPRATSELGGRQKGQLQGNVNAMGQLLLAFLAVSLTGLVLLGPTLIRTIRDPRPPLPGRRAVLYFASLGAGFMMVEIALVQRMHLVLGHPTYALVFVLAGMLSASGAGSALSPFLLRSRRAVSLAALGAAILLMALPYIAIAPLAQLTRDSGLAVRAVWTGLCAGGVGLVLGMFFASGIRFVSRERGAPVALAINGAASVLGSISAIVISMWFGIAASLFVAGCVYLMVAVTGPAWWPQGQSPEAGVDPELS